MTSPDSVAIIGAGLTGLSAALALEEQNVAVELFEKQNRPGGVIRTVHQSGYLYELGPSTLQRGNPALESIIERCGLTGSLIVPEKESRCRFIIRNGRLIALPSSPFSFLTTRWLSMKGKLRLLREPFIPTGTERDTETVSKFAVRRLGKEVLDYGVDPFISGIYAGNPETLSLKLAFPKLYEAETLGGSLFKGFRLLAKQKRQKANALHSTRQPRPPRGIFSFKQGLQELPDQMLHTFQGNFHRRSTVTQIEKTDSGWKLRWHSAEEHTFHEKCFSSLIVTGWSTEIQALLTPFLSTSWPEVEYPSVQVTALGFDRSQIIHPLNGFGVLAPTCEKVPFLGCIFSSSLFPERAPTGKVLITLFSGGTRHPEYTGLSEESISTQLLPSLSRTLGIQGAPCYIDTYSWKRAIPQYNLAHQAFINMRKALEASHEGLYLAGNTVDGISIPNAIQGGMDAANKLIAKKA